LIFSSLFSLFFTFHWYWNVEWSHMMLNCSRATRNLLDEVNTHVCSVGKVHVCLWRIQRVTNIFCFLLFCFVCFFVFQIVYFFICWMLWCLEMKRNVSCVECSERTYFLICTLWISQIFLGERFKLRVR
jgi:hypothetical protein